jgi:hypothetical protein
VKLSNGGEHYDDQFGRKMDTMVAGKLEELLLTTAICEGRATVKVDIVLQSVL